MAEPNFDGIDSLDGIDVDALSRGVSGAVTGLFPVTAELTATAAGETVDVVHERLVQTRQDLDAKRAFRVMGATAAILCLLGVGSSP